MGEVADECWLCADLRQGFSPFACRCGSHANWIGGAETVPETGECVEHLCLNCGVVARIT